MAAPAHFIHQSGFLRYPMLSLYLRKELYPRLLEKNDEIAIGSPNPQRLAMMPP